MTTDARRLKEPAWLMAFAGVAVYFAVWAYSFWPTLQSMIDIWNRSDTFAHGYIILPIAVWLVWYRRIELSALIPKPALLPLLVAAGALLLWMLARLTGVLVVEQIAAVSVLNAVVWAILGHRVALFLAFPILYLYLAVPMGEDLVPPMMEFTATFTVWMLQVTDIPVYREGLHFVIPSGRWSVVEACSGVRYIIASVTLGVLYAYITYNSLKRRLAFIALSALVPIIANGFRAYIIVMLGHLSGNKLAVGVDHLIYGWVFFGLVMLLLFWLGSYWAEPPPKVEGAAGNGMAASQQGLATTFTGPWIIVAVAALTTYLAPVALEARQSGSAGDPVLSGLPATIGEWQRSEPRFGWEPRIRGEHSRLHAAYSDGETAVEVFLGLYPRQTQRAEAVSSTNLAIDEKQGWLILSRRSDKFGLSSGELVANTLVARPKVAGADNEFEQIVVHQWYRVGERNTGNRYIAKIHEALNVLLDGRTDAAYVAVALAADGQGSDQSLRGFVEAAYPVLERAMEATRRDSTP